MTYHSTCHWVSLVLRKVAVYMSLTQRCSTWHSPVISTDTWYHKGKEGGVSTYTIYPAYLTSSITYLSLGRGHGNNDRHQTELARSAHTLSYLALCWTLEGTHSRTYE